MKSLLLLSKTVIFGCFSLLIDFDAFYYYMCMPLALGNGEC